MSDLENHPAMPLLVSQAEAARLLGVERTTIWRMLKRRDLVSVKIGSRRLVTMASVTDYIRSQIENP